MESIILQINDCNLYQPRGRVIIEIKSYVTKFQFLHRIIYAKEVDSINKTNSHRVSKQTPIKLRVYAM